MKRIGSAPVFSATPKEPRSDEIAILLQEVPHIVREVVEAHPLAHSMINHVVANFAANVVLSIGGSPIMSLYGEEAADLALNNGGLVVNMGTLNSESVSNYLKAIAAYNERGLSVVYDPVGASATRIRREAVKQLMRGGYFTLIKGNEGEIKQVFGKSAERQRGVDSGPSTLTHVEKAELARDLAQRERMCLCPTDPSSMALTWLAAGNTVLLTGPVDYLSDGSRTFAIRNGHEYLGQVTGVSHDN